MSFLRSFVVAVVVALTGVTAFADLSKTFAEWPSTAVKWLMTRDEQRAWRNVKSDDEARAFIDLFWARRDPTPGTRDNEFREIFNARVRYADENFGSKKTAGSLSDPGRVFILLGSPKNLLQAHKDTTGAGAAFGGLVVAAPVEGSAGGPAPIQSPGGGMPARTLAAKSTFEYENPMSVGLSGPVVFIQDLRTFEFKIDPQQGNVIGALARAAQKAIVNPDLKQVPEWAATSAPRAVATAPGQAFETEAPPAEVVTTTVTKRTVVQPQSPNTVAGAPGAHDLILLGNVRVIRVGEDENPLRVTPKWTFKKSEDLGFAFEYCASTVGSPRPRLTMSITMSGKVGDEPVSVSAPEDEVLAEPLAKLPGCYLVRGAVPLESLEPASYSFFVNVKDASGKTFTLEKGFTVE